MVLEGIQKVKAKKISKIHIYLLFEPLILQHGEQNQDYKTALLIVPDYECKVCSKFKYHWKVLLSATDKLN